MRTKLTGHSIGGKKSNLVLPDYKLVLDIGVCTDEALRHPTVLVTHGHADHLAGAVQHAATRSDNRPSRFIVPPRLAGPLEEILDAWRRLQGGFAYTVEPLAPGADLSLPGGLAVRAFRTDHVLPSQGYAVIRKIRKLRAEFQGLTGEEIRRLRVEQGVEVQEDAEIVEVAYTGDTRVTAFDREPLIRQARLLVHEATFLGTAVDRTEARRHGHTHLDELAERAEAFENEEVLLCHFSLRHKHSEIHNAVAGLPEALRRRTAVWLD